MMWGLHNIGQELRRHAPYTALGTASGILIMFCLANMEAPRSFSTNVFWMLHPIHVLLSGLVTGGVYRRHSDGHVWATALIGYVGAIGVATLSDCFIPYVGEYLLGLPHKGLHAGFLEKWWLVNPLAALGVGIACWRPSTRFPHFGHVLLSTWASLFHINMAIGTPVGASGLAIIALLLFLAVWIPCCTSDVIFPLLFTAHNKT